MVQSKNWRQLRGHPREVGIHCSVCVWLYWCAHTHTKKRLILTVRFGKAPPRDNTHIPATNGEANYDELLRRRVGKCAAHSTDYVGSLCNVALLLDGLAVSEIQFLCCF